MRIPFTVHPVRTVPESMLDGVRWTVMIRRGGSWPGWRWLDRLDDAVGWDAADVLGFIPMLMGLLTIPSHLIRWTSYRLRRRHDWDVTVYAGMQGDYRPYAALLRETWPDKATAAGRAETLWSHLAAHDTIG